MVSQFLTGGLISVCNIVIHALVMTAVVWASQAMVAMAAPRPNLLLIAVMVATVSVLMAAHTCEVIVWSLAYGLVDAAPANSDLLYFAFVNYTTLGLRRRSSGGAMAVAWADDGNEWCTAVWLVDGRHLRGSAQSNAGPSFRSGEALTTDVGFSVLFLARQV